jgi:hypothetical protein
VKETQGWEAGKAQWKPGFTWCSPRSWQVDIPSTLIRSLVEWKALVSAIPGLGTPLPSTLRSMLYELYNKTR